MKNRLALGLTAAAVIFASGSAWAQSFLGGSDGTSAELEKRYEQFEQRMSGAVLEGRFTIVGKPDEKPAPEQYTIKSVKKLPTGDYWLFQANIKYGDQDLTIPIPIEVKWAGNTPVITLSDTTIPGLGTFGAHVVIDRDKYAGTWSHDDAGGHMFGIIKRPPQE